MRQPSGATFATYETVSLGKQAVGFPATIALAHAAGWDERQRASLYEALANVWLGLQMNDDVVDWEDDLSRGGAWAVAIARAEEAGEARDDRMTDVGVRRRVFASRALERMLSRAHWHFRAARRRAWALGSRQVAAWAGERESRIAHLLAGERTSAGYAARAHALARMGERGPRVKAWDFPYAPVATAAGDDDGEAVDVIVATRAMVASTQLAGAIGDVLGAFDIEPLLRRAPLFWWRVRSEERATREADRARAARARRAAPLRRVGHAREREARAAAPRRGGAARERRGVADHARARARRQSAHADGRAMVPARRRGRSRGRSRARRGRRDAARRHRRRRARRPTQLELDAEIPSASIASRRATLARRAHGRVGERRARLRRGRAGGVAAALRDPEARARRGCRCRSRSCARALDGADVAVCATYVEGSTSPMLDDAFDVARKLGRGGRGTCVLFPTGREASSAPGRRARSWSLSGSASRRAIRASSASVRRPRRDGWFLWRDRMGGLRPFANRGPAVRWLAPGDDVRRPRSAHRDRLFHAESSGASAIAAGVVALVIGANPRSSRATSRQCGRPRACAPPPPGTAASLAPLADARDVPPGRRRSRRAQRQARLRPLTRGARRCSPRAIPSRSARRPRRGRRGARVDALGAPVVERVRAVGGARGVARSVARARHQGDRASRAPRRGARRSRARARRGALLRHVVLAARALLDVGPPPPVRAELARALASLDAETPRAFEDALSAIANRLWPRAAAEPVSLGSTRDDSRLT